MMGVESNEVIIGGVRLYAVFMEVLNIGVEIYQLDLKPFRGDGDALGEVLHYSGVDGGLLHCTKPEVA